MSIKNAEKTKNIQSKIYSKFGLHKIAALNLRENEVTEENFYQERRTFVKNIGSFAAASSLTALPSHTSANPNSSKQKGFENYKKSSFSTNEVLTSFEVASTYNNFYEFSLKKDEPHKLAKNFKTRPWQIVVDGEVEKPGPIDIDKLLTKMSIEERIYRLRCVEAWSMVIPWLGFELASLLKLFQPTSKAKYVAFETLEDSEQFPRQKRRAFGGGLDWPYREGLRIDEATHPLTILAVGMYGKVLPNQNGAPIRLVVPWKYGFKSIKSVVRITLTEKQPKTSWSLSAPSEYGFYANVNPGVSHPRWSQAKERRIQSASLFSGVKRIPTQMFNGYQEHVASIYSNLDLKKFY